MKLRRIRIRHSKSVYELANLQRSIGLQNRPYRLIIGHYPDYNRYIHWIKAVVVICSNQLGVGFRDLSGFEGFDFRSCNTNLVQMRIPM